MLVNRALSEITGYTVEELVGERFDGHRASRRRRQRRLPARAAAGRRDPRLPDREALLRRSGRDHSAIVSVSLVRDRDGAPLHYIAQLQDISERKRLEEHLRHLADHDPLTGLRNRRLFEHDLKLQVARSRRYGELAAADGDRPRRLQAGQRPARPQGGRRHAQGRRHGRSPGACAKRTSSRGSAATSSPCCCPTSDARASRPSPRASTRASMRVRSRGRRRHPSPLGEHRLCASSTSRQTSAEQVLVAGRQGDVRGQAGQAVSSSGAPSRRTAREPRAPARDPPPRRIRSSMQPNERLAVIDLGSNSFRLVVFMAGEGWWKRTDEIYEPVRIGEGLAATRQAGEGADRAGARHARRVRPLLPRQRARRRRGRRGRHERDPRRRERRELPRRGRASARGLPIRVLSREGEARYGYIAAVNSTTLTTATCWTSAAARCSSCAWPSGSRASPAPGAWARCA